MFSLEIYREVNVRGEEQKAESGEQGECPKRLVREFKNDLKLTFCLIGVQCLENFCSEASFIHQYFS